MKPGLEIGTRPDQWLYFVTWPMVYLLGLTPITPNQLGLISQLFGLGFIYTLFTGSYPNSLAVAVCLLSGRILLDYADGQLARYSNRKSQVGALFDLSADFLFILLFSLASAVTLILHQGQDVIPIAMLAGTGLLCAAGSATIHSYWSGLLAAPEESRVSIQKRFVEPPENDQALGGDDSLRLRILKGVFKFGWGTVSKLLIQVIGNRDIYANRRLFLFLLSPVEYTMQLLALVAILTSRVNLTYYYAFQAGSLVYAYLLTVFFSRNNRRE